MSAAFDLDVYGGDDANWDRARRADRDFERELPPVAPSRQPGKSVPRCRYCRRPIQPLDLGELGVHDPDHSECFYASRDYAEDRRQLALFTGDR